VDNPIHQGFSRASRFPEQALIDKDRPRAGAPEGHIGIALNIKGAAGQIGKGRAVYAEEIVRTLQYRQPRVDEGPPIEDRAIRRDAQTAVHVRRTGARHRPAIPID